MKKKRNLKKKIVKESKEDFKEDFKEEFISFGNKKIVFWSVTFATIFLSIIGIPIMIQNEDFFKRFLIIWILEIIYIGMWVKWGERKKGKNNNS